MSRLKAGILGGAHLRQLLINHPLTFNIDISILDSENEETQHSTYLVADLSCYEDVRDFGNTVNCICVADENVNGSALAALEKEKVRVYPGSEVIDLLQNDFLQKKFLESCDVPISPHLAAAWYDTPGNADSSGSFLRYLLSVNHEFTMLIGRNVWGDIEVFDPFIMNYNLKQTQLNFALCPAYLKRKVVFDLCEIAIKIAEHLKLVGLLSVDMLITDRDEIYVNKVGLPLSRRFLHKTIRKVSTQENAILHALGLAGEPGTAAIRHDHLPLGPEAASVSRNMIEKSFMKLLGLSNEALNVAGETSVVRKIGSVENKLSDRDDQRVLQSVAMRHLLRETC